MDYKNLCLVLVEYLNARDSYDRYAHSDDDIPVRVSQRFVRAWVETKASGVWLSVPLEGYDEDEWILPEETKAFRGSRNVYDVSQPEESE